MDEKELWAFVKECRAIEEMIYESGFSPRAIGYCSKAIDLQIKGLVAMAIELGINHEDSNDLE